MDNANNIDLKNIIFLLSWTYDRMPKVSHTNYDTPCRISRIKIDVEAKIKETMKS